MTCLQGFGTFSAHSDVVNCLSIACNGSNNSYITVSSCSKDSLMKIFKVAVDDCSFELQRTFGGLNTELSACSLTSDAKFSLVGGWDNQIYSYSVVNACATGKLLVHDDAVSSISYVSDASNINSLYGTNMLLSGSYDGSAKLWKVQHNSLLHSQPVSEFDGNGIGIKKAALRADIKYAAIGYNDGNLLIWEVSSNRVVLKCEVAHSNGGAVFSGLVWTPDNNKIVCTTKDGCISFFDVSQSSISSAAMGFSALLATKLTPECEIHCMCLAPPCNNYDGDGNDNGNHQVRIFCGCGDGSIRLYSLNKGDIVELYRFPRAHECPVSSIDVIKSSCLKSKEIMITGGFNGTIRGWHIIAQ